MKAPQYTRRVVTWVRSYVYQFGIVPGVILFIGWWLVFRVYREQRENWEWFGMTMCLISLIMHWMTLDIWQARINQAEDVVRQKVVKQLWGIDDDTEEDEEERWG